MNFTRSAWPIRNPVPTALLFILRTLAGIAGFVALNVPNFPDSDFPIVRISAELPGASPPQLENDVARRIEDALARLQGLRDVHSGLAAEVAEVTAEFPIGKPVKEAVADVRDAMAGIRSELPAGLRDPVIARVELAATPVVTDAASSPRLDVEALPWFVDGQVSRRLRAVHGVGAVVRGGGVEREVRVALAPARLLALNAGAADVSRQLQQEAAGGRVDPGGAEQPVRTVATVQSARAIADLDLTLDDGRRIRLDPMATITDTTAEPHSAALLDGSPVVAFDVLRARRRWDRGGRRCRRGAAGDGGSVPRH